MHFFGFINQIFDEKLVHLETFIFRVNVIIPSLSGVLTVDCIQQMFSPLQQTSKANLFLKTSLKITFILFARPPKMNVRQVLKVEETHSRCIYSQSNIEFLSMSCLFSED